MMGEYTGVSMRDESFIMNVLRKCKKTSVSQHWFCGTIALLPQ